MSLVSLQRPTVMSLTNFIGPRLPALQCTECDQIGDARKTWGDDVLFDSCEDS